MNRALSIFLFAVVALVLGALVLGACGGGDDDGGGEATPPPPAAEGGGEGDAEAGKAVFDEAGCGGCHTLEAAGSNGATAPNLDDVQPSFDTVVSQVTNGGGGMPAFGDKLSEKQIQDVAAFVSESAGGG